MFATITRRCKFCWSILNSYPGRKQILLSPPSAPRGLWLLNRRQALMWLFVDKFWFTWHFAWVKSNQARRETFRICRLINRFGPRQRNYRCENESICTSPDNVFFCTTFYLYSLHFNKNTCSFYCLYLQTRLLTLSNLRDWQYDDVKDVATQRGKVKCEEKVCLQSFCNNREKYSSNRDKTESKREPGNTADEEEARHSPNLALLRCLKLPAPRMIHSECVVSCANLKKRTLGFWCSRIPPSNLREHVQVQSVFSVVIVIISWVGLGAK